MPDTPDPVSAIFARAAEALAGFAASGASHRVTVTTADRANPLCPWSLAWAERLDYWSGDLVPGLLVRRHVDGDEPAQPWADGPAEARLATLRQLPELVTRVAAAAVEAEQAAEPGEVERWAGQVAGAIGALRGTAPAAAGREGGQG